MKENLIKDKTFDSAKRIVSLCGDLQDGREYVLSRQLMRSGTAPGALVREAEHAESKKDFIHKMSIGLKEANETEYWLDLALAGGYITESDHRSLREECISIIKILTSIIKTSKANLKSQSK